MKKVLITGGAGGLGLATAEYMTENGWQVYAADYNKEGLDKINNKKIIPIQVDISNDESVKKALEEVRKTTDTLDGIVNFAGIMVMGSVIETDTESMKRILDINLLGMYRMNKAFFELIRKGKGRIVNVSSEYGTLGAVPFNGFYTTSKHAVEMYSDSLRRELVFLGVPVVKIRPGAFKSNMQGGAGAMLEKVIANSTYFKEILKKTRSMSESGTGKAKDPIILAKKVYSALTDKKPKLAYSANLNKQQKFLACLPERLQDTIYKKVLG